MKAKRENQRHFKYMQQIIEYRQVQRKANDTIE